MDQKKVGKLISILRKEKGLTQQDLADKLGVSPKTISKWECGNGLPDVSFLKNVSEILGITIEELLEGKIEKQKNNNIKNINFNRLFLILPLIIILFVIVIIIFNHDRNINNLYNNTEANCEVVKTYFIDNIGESNDENYLYVTMHEFQVEGTYTIKLPKTISDNLEVGSSYEFTFKTTSEYVNGTISELFANSEIINTLYSDKVGLDRTNKYYCN